MKRNVKFPSGSQRRMSKGSMSDMDSNSPTEEKPNGPRSPTRNGNITRPDYDRTDTGASGWATENEDDKVGDVNHIRWANTVFLTRP